MGYGSFFYGSAASLALIACVVWALARLPPRSGVRRSRLINAALVLLAALTPLVVAEGWLLFFVDTTDDALATLTSRRWVERHLPQPLGSFRGRTAPSADAGERLTLYMAVLGDSVTYGQGVERDEDVYPAILERELRARGLRIDVYNFSLPGWNTAQQLAELRRQVESGAKFNAVVLGFCLNDIGEFVRADLRFAEASERLQTPPALLAPLVDRSFLASMLYNRYVVLTSEWESMWAGLVESHRSPRLFGALSAALAELARLTESIGAPLVVLTFPTTTTPWEQYPNRDIHRKLDDFWERLGVTHVDLLPAFERHPPRSLHAGIFDAHPNELAHRLAAAELADRLARLLVSQPQGRGPVPDAGRQ